MAQLVAPAERAEVVGSSTLERVAREARALIERCATDVDLTPQRVADTLGWSLRQVQVALQRDGATAGALIRERRLDLAAQLLRTADADVPLSRIAHECGFSSLSTFTSAFGARFGTPPGRARRQHLR